MFGPWLLKPRSQARSAGIQKVHDAATLWQKLQELGDEQSGYILEEFTPGDIYHVDSILYDHQVLFVEVSKYGRPPLEVAHQGGIFMTCIQDRQGADAKALKKINAKLLSSFGLKKGVAHTEFIKSHADGKFYFLETGARVGGAYISNVLHAGIGINLWEEWAKIELLSDKESYTLPTAKKDYAGIALCLAHQEWPDTSAYNDSEVTERIHKAYHAGLILKSKDPRPAGTGSTPIVVRRRRRSWPSDTPRTAARGTTDEQLLGSSLADVLGLHVRRLPVRDVPGRHRPVPRQ